MTYRHNCERCWTQDPEAPTVKKYDEWLCPGHLDDVEEEARVLMADAAIEFGWVLTPEGRAAHGYTA
jgi:hypothetical protein